MAGSLVIRLRLALGFIQYAMNLLWEVDRGKKSPVSPVAIEIIYTAYFYPLYMGEVAEMLGVSRSTATDHIDYLEREGYVRREPDPEDRRRIRVVTTDKAGEWILSIEERLFGYIESCLSNMTEEEQEEFATLCTRFTGVFDNRTFGEAVSQMKTKRDDFCAPLLKRRRGRLLRLEETADERYPPVADKYTLRRNKMMFKERIPETEEGIQDIFTVEIYDMMQRNLRDEGHLPAGEYIKAGIASGEALEIGPGPGYTGLEWLKVTENARLTGVEISPEMIRVAEKNAADYGLSGRVKYVEGNAMCIPLDDNIFDAVFSNGSMHEWEDPVAVFNEVARVLKSGGVFCITDLRRDLSEEVFGYMYNACSPEEIRPGFKTSVMAAYTPGELEELLEGSELSGWKVIGHPYGLVITGKKEK
ncbi:MAG: methyltransferase domain-containing protein [Methanomicrobiaceae archaeon]|nr:methyltransferase domain-containing protein [Methanomicrobiaceae archaeon]